MAVNKTKKQAHNYMKKLKGKAWDFDNAYGAQCYDFINFYYNYLTGGRLYGMYAKNIHIDNKKVLEKYGTIYKNTPDFLPEKGDIFIMHGGYGGGAGHTGVVWSANLNTYTGLEQNWYGGAMNNPPEVAQLVTHTYDNPVYFWRPDYKKTASTKDKVKDVVAKPKKKVNKKKIMLVAGHGYQDPGAVSNGENERDFIRKNITPQVAKLLRSAGHEVALYGGSKQTQNLFSDTNYGNQIGNHKDYGMYWINGKGYDVVVEFHLDSASPSASGGHVIKNAYSADEIDKNLQKALEDTVGTIRGITTRRDLLNCNVAYDLNMNYRLIELGFISNKGDMDYIKDNLDKFNKEIAGAIHDAPIGGTSAGKSTKKKTPVKKKPAPVVNHGAWSTNKYGSIWKKEKGRFTNGSEPITVRSIGPFLTCPIAYSFQPGGWCDYDEVILQSGYVWVAYTWQGKRYFLPVRTWNEVEPWNNGYSVGQAWGKFS